MRTKHWIVVGLFISVVASAQAYAVATNSTHKSDRRAAAAEVDQPRTSAGPRQVVAQDTPAEAEPDAPRANESVGNVETLIVGFKQDFGGKLLEAIVRAAGATPGNAVSAPGTLVVTVDKAELDETVAQLEKHVLVDYVAVPQPSAPSVSSSL